MLTDYISEQQRFVTCPNQDTVYGAGYQRVSTPSRSWCKCPTSVSVSTPTRSQMPARTRLPPSASSTERSRVIICSLGPTGRATRRPALQPSSAHPTDLVAIFPRVFQDDTPEDKLAIQPLLRPGDGLSLERVRRQDEDQGLEGNTLVPAPAGQGGGETKWVSPEKFFDQLPEVMQAVPPLPGEEALYGMIKSVLDAAENDPQIKATLQQTAVAAEEELIKPLFEFRNNGRPVGNGWTSPPNGRGGVRITCRVPRRPSRTCTTTRRRKRATSTPTSTRRGRG